MLLLLLLQSEFDAGLEQRLSNPDDMFEGLPALAAQCLAPLPWVQATAAEVPARPEAARDSAWKCVVQNMIIQLAAAGASDQAEQAQGSVAAGPVVGLVCHNHVSPEQLLQQLELSMERAAQSIMM